MILSRVKTFLKGRKSFELLAVMKLGFEAGQLDKETIFQTNEMMSDRRNAVEKVRYCW